MSGWLAIGLILIGLGGVALAMVLIDMARGDVGGHHTMARARRLLVVATDDATSARADAWVAEQRKEHPELQCFVLVEAEGQRLFEAIEDVTERERPDAIVMVRHAADRHDETGTFARLKGQGFGPIDSIYVDGEERA